MKRLQRHRALWVIAVAALLIKLVSGSVCLADTSIPHVASTTPAASQIFVGATAAIPVADEAGAAGCLLGEASCHCACAESVPVPMTTLSPLAVAHADFIAPKVASGLVPFATASPLRPPIA